MSELVYYCSVCGKESKVKEGEPIPFCCHKEMEPLPYCTLAQTAEMARPTNPDEPCDEGTGRPKRE